MQLQLDAHAPEQLQLKHVLLMEGYSWYDLSPTCSTPFGVTVQKGMGQLQFHAGCGQIRSPLRPWLDNLRFLILVAGHCA